MWAAVAGRHGPAGSTRSTEGHAFVVVDGLVPSDVVKRISLIRQEKHGRPRASAESASYGRTSAPACVTCSNCVDQHSSPGVRLKPMNRPRLKGASSSEGRSGSRMPICA